jgi:hypothetical protein
MRAERALFEGLKSKEKDQKRRALHALPAHSAGIECAHGCAPLYPGPLRARRVGEGKSEGWLARMRASFSSAQEVLSKNPVARPRT